MVKRMRPKITLDGERPFNKGWVKQWSFQFGLAEFRLELFYDGHSPYTGLTYWRQTFSMKASQFTVYFKKSLSNKDGTPGPSEPSFTGGSLLNSYPDRSFELKWAGRTIDFWDGPGSGGGNERREIRIETDKSAATYVVSQ